MEVFYVVVFGDVQGDAEIDSLDSALILQYDSGNGSLTGVQLVAADANHDGDVDSLDSVLILKYDVNEDDINQAITIESPVPLSLYYSGY